MATNTKLEIDFSQNESDEDELTSLQKKNVELKAEVTQLQNISNSNAESVKGWKSHSEK